MHCTWKASRSVLVHGFPAFWNYASVCVWGGCARLHLCINLRLCLSFSAFTCAPDMVDCAHACSLLCIPSSLPRSLCTSVFPWAFSVSLCGLVLSHQTLCLEAWP